VLAALNHDVNRLSQRYLWPLVWAGLRAEADLRAAGGTAGIAPELQTALAELPAETAPTKAYQFMAQAEAARISGEPNWAPAVAAFRALQWPWPLAYCLYRSAEADLVADRRTDGQAALSECIDIARRLGARPLLADADRLARAAGLDVDQQEARAADPLASYGLTSREREVLLLLAAGRSNPQIAQTLFISPKTASVHVSNILGKLGLSSRVEAAGLISRLGVQI
jgi:DNA-binding CsgD family transcriptional regulator